MLEGLKEFFYIENLKNFKIFSQNSAYFVEICYNNIIKQNKGMYFMKKEITCITIFALELLLILFGVLIIQNNIIVGIILFVLAILLLIFVVVGYNKMVRYKNKVKESLALIDIQLKLRFDLIPNLVNVVKGYTEHEKEVLTEVVKLRNLALSSENEEQKIEYANKLVPYLKSVVAIAEGYPDIKSSSLFKNLMEQLVDVEDRIVASRRIYDSNVNLYNTIIETFPNNILAFLFEFDNEKMFKIDAGENLCPTIKY